MDPEKAREENKCIVKEEDGSKHVTKKKKKMKNKGETENEEESRLWRVGHFLFWELSLSREQCKESMQKLERWKGEGPLTGSGSIRLNILRYRSGPQLLSYFPLIGHSPLI